MPSWLACPRGVFGCNCSQRGSSKPWKGVQVSILLIVNESHLRVMYVVINWKYCNLFMIMYLSHNVVWSLAWQSTIPAAGFMSVLLSFTLRRPMGRGLRLSGRRLLNSWTTVCFTFVERPAMTCVQTFEQAWFSTRHKTLQLAAKLRKVHNINAMPSKMRLFYFLEQPALVSFEIPICLECSNAALDRNVWGVDWPCPHSRPPWVIKIVLS